MALTGGRRMTNELEKQIIIYKKECYNEPHCSLNQVLEQLKAKEQECEELKEKVKKYGEINEQETKDYAELKAENEKLDTENKRLVAELANPVFDSFEELDKLKQTLTEIKKIAEKNLNIHTCAFKGCGYDLITNQILQKISKCEVE